MKHRAWSSKVEVPYSFSRSYVKFQGHTALEIVEFDPNWAFPDCNSSLNSPMAMKCCTKLETAKEWCPIVSKVIHQISRSHGTKHHRFWPKLGVSGRSFQIPQIFLVRYMLTFFKCDTFIILALYGFFLHYFRLWYKLNIEKPLGGFVMIYPITIESIQNFVFLVNNEMGIIWVLSSQKR